MTPIDVRGLSTIVRDALQVYADQQAGRQTAATTLQDDLANRIANGLVPTLRQSFLDMVAMSAEWQEKRFQTVLAEAAVSGQLVAGYRYETWQQWGMLLLALQTWLATPIEAMGGITPKDALLRRYALGEDVATVVEPEPIIVPEVQP